MDKGVTRNDFTKMYAKCKDCAFQNKLVHYAGRCQIYTNIKPDQVMDNGDCKFYTKKTVNETDKTLDK